MGREVGEGYGRTGADLERRRGAGLAAEPREVVVLPPEKHVAARPPEGVAGCCRPRAHPLREAEVACGFPQGRLQYLGGSEHPLRKDASNKPPLTVITGAVGARGSATYDCLERFKSSQGYQIQQLTTD